QEQSCARADRHPSPPPHNRQALAKFCFGRNSAPHCPIWIKFCMLVPVPMPKESISLDSPDRFQPGKTKVSKRYPKLWENHNLCAVMGLDRAWKLVDCDQDATTNNIYTVCKKSKLTD
ncbi:unnamed protein product, partial [Cyprideis torosa]